MRTWAILFIIKLILGATCPLTYKKIGRIVELVDMIATVVFVILVFFLTNYKVGLGTIAAAILVAFFVPTPDINRIDDNRMFGYYFRIYSLIGSILSPILLILMYLDLFEVI